MKMEHCNTLWLVFFAGINVRKEEIKYFEVLSLAI